MPEIGNPTGPPWRRLWPIAAFALIAGGLGFVYPGVAAVGTGFALAAALMLASRARAPWPRSRSVTASGSTSSRDRPCEPVKLVRTPGLRRERPPPGHPPPPPTAPA